MLIDPREHSGHFAAFPKTVHAHVGNRSGCSFHSTLMSWNALSPRLVIRRLDETPYGAQAVGTQLRNRPRAFIVAQVIPDLLEGQPRRSRGVQERGGVS